MRRLEAAAVAVLMAALAGQLFHGLLSDGLTNDEILYIADGYRQQALADYRLNPTHPPLAKRLAALGLIGLPLRIPERRSDEAVLEWSYRFLHVENDPAVVLRRARVPVALLTGCLAVLLWAWARSLHGPAAGILALALVAFHPSLLAHGHLATTDLPAAFAMIAASWAFWRWARAPGLGWAALSALALAVGVCTRLTVWVLLPAFAALCAVSLARRPAAERKAALRAAAILVAVGLVVVPLVIWASYDFRYAPFPGGSVAEVVPGRLKASGRMVEALREIRALPEAYLEGLRYQLQHNRSGHPAYLLGQRSKTGWPHYFLVAFVVKNTPGFLLAAAVALGLACRRRIPFAAHVLVPAGLLFAAVSAGSIQIGERYLLPVYAYLILLVSGAMPVWLGTRRGRLLLAAILVLHALPALAASSRGYLAYFNLLAGGTQGGHRVLLDSNLDWGQDLPRLAAWMRAEGVPAVQLAYHGTDVPDRFGIRHEDLPGAHLYPARPPARPLQGTVAVSPNLLYGLLPRLGDPYAVLRARPPAGRAGVFFIYRLP